MSKPALAQQAESIPIGELVILPFAGFPVQIAQALAADLAARQVTTRIDAPVPLPDAAYAPQRGQYRAELLLALVSGHGARHVLGLTQRDLFAGELNFVFGIASAGGACVVSTARLVIGADDALFRGRLLKEAVHELGHTLGLPHCDDPGCVMCFSNRLARRYRPQEPGVLQALCRAAPRTAAALKGAPRGPASRRTALRARVVP